MTETLRPLEQSGRLQAETIEPSVQMLKALAHPIRLQIIRLLADKKSYGIEDETCCASTEVCVCKITELFDVSMPTISHHLKLLREAGLVDARRDGVWMYYSLREGRLDELIGMLDSLTGNVERSETGSAAGDGGDS